MPTAEQLAKILKQAGRGYMLNGHSELQVRFFEGNAERLWGESHPSYEGFRVIELVIKYEDKDEESNCVFFDHEDGETFTFVRVL